MMTTQKIKNEKNPCQTISKQQLFKDIEKKKKKGEEKEKRWKKEEKKKKMFDDHPRSLLPGNG